MQNTIIILGPTASGKSALAVKIAKKINAEIINMDSMQVYKEIPILSAAPNEDEMDNIPHHLFLHKSAAHTYSTGEYIAEAKAKIDEIHSKGKKAILVGGTGLYAHSLTQGMVETPPVPAEIRANTRRIVEADKRGSYNRLRKHDPEAAERIEPNDIVRIARALEVFDATGKSLSDWHKEEQPPILANGSWHGIGIMPEREIIYEKIAKRFFAMADNGGIEEVETLLNMKLDESLPAMKALGVPSLVQYLEGQLDIHTAIDRAITETRQYAKRQLTWLRNRAIDWPKYETTDAAFNAVIKL